VLKIVSLGGEARCVRTVGLRCKLVLACGINLGREREVESLCIQKKHSLSILARNPQYSIAASAKQ